MRCIIIARPIKSEMPYTQIIGRGLRTADSKQDCLILHYSNTTLRLGFVTDIGQDRLDDSSVREPMMATRKEALAKERPLCSFLKPPKVHACPACGFRLRGSRPCDAGTAH